jgi:GT2 family glycosyltransferase
MPLVVIIPAYGREELTTTVIGDIAREDARGREHIDCVVVDNQGGYTECWRESVIRPGRNLGWLGGTNAGLEAAHGQGYDAYVLLNNDVRLSHGFFSGLVRAQKLTRAGLVAPTYDASMGHQRLPYTGPAEEFKPRRRHWRSPMIDGSCMYVPAATRERIGLLDERFMPHGWGAEIDYSYRVWDAKMPVVVTALAYMNHQQGSTAESLHGKDYYAEAWETASRVLSEKYGRGSKGWGPRSGINPETETTDPLTDRQRLVATIKAELKPRVDRRKTSSSR